MITSDTSERLSVIKKLMNFMSNNKYALWSAKIQLLALY